LARPKSQRYEVRIPYCQVDQCDHEELVSLDDCGPCFRINPTAEHPPDVLQNMDATADLLSLLHVEFGSLNHSIAALNRRLHIPVSHAGEVQCHFPIHSLLFDVAQEYFTNAIAEKIQSGP
jgi:hypothetical protein